MLNKSQNTNWKLAEECLYNQNCKKVPYVNFVRWKERTIREGIRLKPVPLGGSCERGKGPSTWEYLLAQRSAGTSRKMEWLRICSRGRYEEGMGAARQCTEGLAQMVPAMSLHFPAHEAFLPVGGQHNSCFSGHTQLEALVWLCGGSLDYSLCCNYGCTQDGRRVCHSSSLSACSWWDTVLVMLGFGSMHVPEQDRRPSLTCGIKNRI